MRISQHYNLGVTQPSLEFVDVDVRQDAKVFIDPKVLKDLTSPWAVECVALLQDYFTAVIRHIQGGKIAEAVELLSHLNEPNETRLGVSKNDASGRAVGAELSGEIGDALVRSAAAKTGLLEDLEDTALFIPGVSFDIVSDMTTNVIRSQLIQFTQEMARKYPNLDLVQDTYTGPVWDRHQHKWVVKYDEMLMAGIGPILLVPKSIVRRKKATFNPEDYLIHHILPELQQREFAANSSLVETLKKGGTRVTKVSVKRKIGLARKPGEGPEKPVRPGKEVNLEVTLERPALLDEFRASRPHGTPPLSHEDLADVTQTEPPDWDGLLGNVIQTPTGKADASAYHLAVEELLTAVFYPALDFMKHEFPLNAGRKRVDITYTNMARLGFFDWVNRVVGAPAHEVYVECKNYSKDVGNPELDQILGRFSVNRGRLGLMLYRSTSDKPKVIASCRDTALSGGGFILPLDDDDLRALVEERKASPDSVNFDFLRSKYNELV